MLTRTYSNLASLISLILVALKGSAPFMKKNFFTYLFLLTTSLILVSGCCAAKAPDTAKAAATSSISATAPARNYQRLVVISDAHYPSKTPVSEPEKRQSRIDNKLKTAATISSWKDVDLVVFTGDIVEMVGDTKTLEQAKGLFNKVNKPKTIIAGNHEVIYNLVNGKKVRVNVAEREKNIKRFQEAFQLPNLYYTKEMGRYLLIFLSCEPGSGKFSTEISDQQLNWLKTTLKDHPEQPTLIFFHAPLKDTLFKYNESINMPYEIAQPVKKLEKVLLANPQIALWISGHIHTPANNPSFANLINYYHHKILDIHNPSLDGSTIWTNSLYLYPNKIVIKTFNHTTGQWMENLTRTVNFKADGTAVVPYEGASAEADSAKKAA